MAGRCWLPVLTAFFLCAGNSLADVDQNWLTSIIEGIKNEYELGDSYSLAANVPLNQNPNSLQQIFQDDPADRVKQAVSGGRVYRGRRVVASAQPGALSRVLDNIEPFIKSSQGSFLVIYSEESPCGPTCTTNANQDGITAKINNVAQNWRGYAFVFSKVVRVPAADTSQLSKSFKQLGITKLGLDNIFRCYGDDPFQCTSCSSDGDVTPACVANNAPSNQEQEADEDISSVPAAGADMGEGFEMGTSVGEGLNTGIGTGSRRGEGKRGRLSRCKGPGSRKGGCKGGKGSKVRGQCKRKGSCKRKGGIKQRKGGKVRGQCKRKGSCKRKGGIKQRKGGKVRGQYKRGRGCKRKGGGRRGKGGKVKKRGKKRGRRKGRRSGKGRRGRRNKGQRGGKCRRRTKSRKGKGRSRRRGRGRKS
uniref:uncharacterized protein n=1 Tax=Semicossyphus pulcher TaxID=241346 RepID=UPI0037E83E89